MLLQLNFLNQWPKKVFLHHREHEKWKKREQILEEQRMNKRIKKSMKEIEQDKRETGLQTSIDSSNKVKVANTNI